MRRVRLAAATAVLVLAVPPSAGWAQPGPPAGTPWGMHEMWGFWGFGMGLLMLVFWGLVIAALVLGIRWLVTQGGGRRDQESPLDIARRRYARGEITREQFEALKRDLE